MLIVRNKSDMISKEICEKIGWARSEMAKNFGEKLL